MDNLAQHIQNPQLIASEDVAKLEDLVQEFPYYQTAQLLITKGLLNTDSIRYNRQLKKAAAYALDRKQLFKLIILNKVQQQIIENISEKIEATLAIGKPYNALIRLLQGKLSQSSCKALARSLHEAFSTRPSTRVLSERLSPGQRTSGF